MLVIYSIKIKVMRNRINTRAICSSDNYKGTKKMHILMLQRNHENNAEYFSTLKAVPLNEKQQEELKMNREKLHIMANLRKWHDEGNKKEVVINPFKL